MNLREFQVNVPTLGPAVTSVLVVEWLVSENEAVDSGTDLVVVEADKAEVAIPAPVAGRVHRIVARPDEEVEVGAALCVLVE